MIDVTIEKECKAIIRAARGTGREESIARAVRSIYNYAANLEWEHGEMSAVVSKLSDDKTALTMNILETYGNKVAQRIYDTRHNRR